MIYGFSRTKNCFFKSNSYCYLQICASTWPTSRAKPKQITNNIIKHPAITKFKVKSLAVVIEPTTKRIAGSTKTAASTTYSKIWNT